MELTAGNLFSPIVTAMLGENKGRLVRSNGSCEMYDDVLCCGKEVGGPFGRLSIKWVLVMGLVGLCVIKDRFCDGGFEASRDEMDIDC